MSIEENRALWEKFKAADQGHDPEAMCELYADDLDAGALSGKAAMVAFTRLGAEAFTERRDYRTVVIGDDAIGFSWHLSIQNTGLWIGEPPTGRQYEGDGATLLTVRNGLIRKIEAFGVQEAITAITAICQPNA